jgi:hypothetical protein
MLIKSVLENDLSVSLDKCDMTFGIVPFASHYMLWVTIVGREMNGLNHTADENV